MRMSRQAMRSLRHDAKFGGYHTGEMMGALRACRRAEQALDAQNKAAYGESSSYKPEPEQTNQTHHVFGNNITQIFRINKLVSLNCSIPNPKV